MAGDGVASLEAGSGDVAGAASAAASSCERVDARTCEEGASVAASAGASAPGGDDDSADCVSEAAGSCEDAEANTCVEGISVAELVGASAEGGVAGAVDKVSCVEFVAGSAFSLGVAASGVANAACGVPDGLLPSGDAAAASEAFPAGLSGAVSGIASGAEAKAADTGGGDDGASAASAVATEASAAGATVCIAGVVVAGVAPALAAALDVSALLIL